MGASERSLLGQRRPGRALRCLARLLAWPLAVLQGKAQLFSVLVALTPVLLLSSASWIYLAYLRRLLQYKLAALSSLLSVLVGGVVGVALAYGGGGVWSLVGQQVAGAFAAFVVLQLSVPWSPSLQPSLRHLRELTRFAATVVISDLLDFAGRRLNTEFLASSLAHMRSGCILSGTG